jgi:hypothetical protein
LVNDVFCHEVPGLGEKSFLRPDSRHTLKKRVTRIQNPKNTRSFSARVLLAHAESSMVKNKIQKIVGTDGK